MTTTENGTLMGALMKAQNDLPAFAKDSNNKFADYDYSSADAIIDQSRAVLHKHGLIAWVYDISHEIIPGEPVKANLTITLELRHVPTNESIRVKRSAFAEPAKGKPLDKAMLGAETSALGYWLRGLLMAPRLDTQEVSARDDMKYDPSQIGTPWVDKWLTPTLKAMELSPDFLRAQLIKNGKDADTVAMKPWHWPIEWKAQIKLGLSRHPKASGIEPVRDPDDDLDGLPQIESPPTNGAARAAPGVDSSSTANGTGISSSPVPPGAASSPVVSAPTNTRREVGASAR